MICSEQISPILLQREVNYEHTLTMCYAIHVYVVISLVKESAENLCRMIENSKNFKVFRGINLLDNYIFSYQEGRLRDIPIHQYTPLQWLPPSGIQTYIVLPVLILFTGFITLLIYLNFSFHRLFLFSFSSIVFNRFTRRVCTND